MTEEHKVGDANEEEKHFPFPPWIYYCSFNLKCLPCKLREIATIC